MKKVTSLRRSRSRLGTIWAKARRSHICPKMARNLVSSLPERFYDFRKIGPTDVVHRTFVIRNDGEAPDH